MKSNIRIYWILAILSVAGYAWIGFHLLSNGVAETPLTVCLVKNATCIPCPSCGITRSLLLLISGNIQGAMLMNPLGCVVAFAMLIIPVWILSDVVTRKDTLARSFLWTENKIKTRKAIYIPLVALALLNWGWNILKEL
ncbi:MAG: DUF2752 domain-containing protein [Cyclobacteriaceae bacterium]